MKFTKELEERIDKEIEKIEKNEREGNIEFYSEEEAFDIMFGDLINEKKI